MLRQKKFVKKETIIEGETPHLAPTYRYMHHLSRTEGVHITARLHKNHELPPKMLPTGVNKTRER